MPGRSKTPRAGARVALRLGLVVATILVVLGVLEVVLRLRPTLLGYAYANGALSRYTVRSGGIYYRDRNLRMNFMIPNFQTTMYANGYVWHHQTDALGFRNASLHVPADVVLLGDSLVYGHGVDFEDTLGNRLEQRSGLRVANLGLQGDCAFQEAYRLTAYIEVFKPRFVDRKSTRLNSSHVAISYAVFCLKKKTKNQSRTSGQSMIISLTRLL